MTDDQKASLPVVDTAKLESIRLNMHIVFNCGLRFNFGCIGNGIRICANLRAVINITLYMIYTSLFLLLLLLSRRAFLVVIPRKRAR